MDLFAAMIAVALSQSPAAGPEAGESAGEAERQICRRVTPSSRTGARRVCKTAAEWEASRINPETDMASENALAGRGRNPTTGCLGGLPPGPGEQMGPQ